MAEQFSLTVEQIERNFTTFIEYANDLFTNRRDSLMSMYEDLEIKLATAPSSGTEYYHNAFSGGYMDHTLRVYEFAHSLYNTWQELGLVVDNFTTEELAFVALHHDIGKVGFPGETNDRYIANQNDYSRERGTLYEINPDTPNAQVTDLSLYLLQRYGIRLSWNEYHAIRIHDGLYEYGNKSYFITYDHKARLRTSLPVIIHHADLMATQFEYERWAKSTGKVLKNYEG